MAMKQWKNIKFEFRCDMSETTLIIATQSKLHVCAVAATATATQKGAAQAVPLRNQYEMTKKGRKFASTHTSVVCWGWHAYHCLPLCKLFQHTLDVVKSNEQFLLNRLVRVPTQTQLQISIEYTLHTLLLFSTILNCQYEWISDSNEVQCESGSAVRILKRAIWKI